MRKVLNIRFTASNPDTREKGLMFADPLKDDEVALFVFPRSDRYAFWNKNVSFDLDLAFLDENMQVVDLASMPAQSTKHVASSQEARYVVEASRGTFARLGVKKGDVINCRGNQLLVRIASEQI